MRTVFWFRKGLRLHDNPALVAALEGCTTLYPVFCLDPWFVSSGKVGTNRMRFLLESLRDLDTSLRELDSRLIVLQGNPKEELPRIFGEWDVQRLAYETDIEPYAKSRDGEINQLAATAGVELVTRVGHTLCDPDALLRRAGGTPTTTYSSFLNHFEQEIKAVPIVSLARPMRLPPVGDAAAATDGAVPALRALGGPYAAAEEEDSRVLCRGGEAAALERMRAHLQRTQWVAAFEKPMTSPAELNPFGEGTRSTTVLSPYLKFGCLSPRLFYSELAQVYAKAGKHSKPPVSLHGQLLWREFYYVCGHGTPHFDRMEGNAICKQIPWESDAALLSAWSEGRTGYPWIDACMTQLREEGWIHHLARHSVACFLTRGDLYQSWEAGAAVFDEYLLDADWAINNGNWMWLSCSCFFYQYFRCYSPVAFPKKWDKNGDYVRHWLPQLAKLPAKYIYEPWKAPIADQKAAGCIIGKDYPKPIVVHETAVKVCMDKMNKAYAAGKAAKEADKEAAKAGKAAASGQKRKLKQGTLK